ncbi:hypothetical protein ONS95_000443 [Cadophora gregata]|uniref:uncharacterized protein n=1 Tax=Cadophora gregata TaxID=51156 RepID=UPI0026DAA4EF|nr:uncharacterized protein ONS95_000443 [Cadophora gregata]KAK0125549.1 hypothetical protein ONS96_009386 [Cadophora gregata f. sp. sojae]KAK0128471.1 hypothetical protein ONS95_000443 [Cadophora gregata]
MSIAKVLKTKLTSTISDGIRTVGVGYVEKTDIWTRSFIDSGVQKQFAAAAQQHMDSFRTDTTAVALQETPHKSNSDNRTHFTAVELNAAGKVVGKRHFSV